MPVLYQEIFDRVHEKEDKKVEKYDKLKRQLNICGNCEKIVPIVVGTLGSVMKRIRESM